MGQEEVEAAAKKELRQIKRILKTGGISGDRMKLLQPVAENTAWMKAKLDEAREDLKDGRIVVEYDNGGGQSGIKENPALRSYEALWKSYMAGMKLILDAIPAGIKAVAPVESSPKNVLQMIREKHGVVD